MSNQISEEWRDIVGYEGLYQVSNYGNVRRVVAMGVNGMYPAWGLLKPSLDGYGYLFIFLCHPRKKHKNTRIHRLVAFAFLGDPPAPDYQINHKNGQKDDNRLENLEWVTRSENQKHAYRELGKPKGQDHTNAKLTDTDVLQMRMLYDSGQYTQRELAAMYNVSQVNVWRIIHRKKWHHLEGSTDETT